MSRFLWFTVYIDDVVHQSESYRFDTGNIDTYSSELGWIQVILMHWPDIWCVRLGCEKLTQTHL